MNAVVNGKASTAPNARGGLVLTLLMLLFGLNHTTHMRAPQVQQDFQIQQVFLGWRHCKGNGQLLRQENATSLYFARPGNALMGEAATDTTYKGAQPFLR